MTGYRLVNLKDMLDVPGEKETEEILSRFLCPLNQDVENFLRYKAIQTTKLGNVATHIVFVSYKDQWVIAGYYTLTTKIFVINKSCRLNSKTRHRINKFAAFNHELSCYEIPAPLIAQLGKNFANGYNELITGDELLQLACESIKQLQMICGGKVAYLECEDKPSLINFYTRNGFVPFDKRELDRDEQDVMSGAYLIQMLRYFS